MNLDIELVKSELEKLEGLPVPVSGWEVTLTEHWGTGDPVVWIRAMLEGPEIDYDIGVELRDIVRQRIFDLALRETHVEWWPFVQIRQISDERERLA